MVRAAVEVCTFRPPSGDSPLVFSDSGTKAALRQPRAPERSG